MHKFIIGLALAIAVLGGAYVNRPKIEVTAEATANATSTIIVPTSTSQIVSHETSVATTTPDVAPQTINIYKTYVESNGEIKEEAKPVIEPVKVEPITYVPAPVYTTTYTPMPVQPVQPVIEPVARPVVQPIVSSAPVVEPTPVIEAPFYSEYPHYWIEERNNGRWIFFQATWSDGSKGKIMCNGKGQGYVISGLPSIVEEKNLADQITGGSLIAEGRYVSCTFSVGDNGGVTASIVVK